MVRRGSQPGSKGTSAEDEEGGAWCVAEELSGVRGWRRAASCDGCDGGAVLACCWACGWALSDLRSETMPSSFCSIWETLLPLYIQRDGD